MKKTYISIKGVYPPMVGGISTHIYRVGNILKEKEILNKIYCTSSITYNNSYLVDVSFPKIRYDIIKSLLWFIIYGIRDKSKTIHLHGNPVYEGLTIILLKIIRKNIIYTIHDQMILQKYKDYPFILRIIFNMILRYINVRWIVVNKDIKYQLENINRETNNVNVIPAYIESECPSVDNDNKINDFIIKKEKIITIYAHSTRKYNGKDLYGIDIALKTLALITKKNPQIGLIICLPGNIDEDMRIYYKKIIDTYNLCSKVLIYNKPLLNPLLLWKKSNIVLRPTLTDGDSMIVREALSQGTIVIASDVVERPKEVLVFKNENIYDLEKIILENIDIPKKKIITYKKRESLSIINNIYDISL